MSQWGKDTHVFLQAGGLCGTPTQRVARRSSVETGWSSRAQGEAGCKRRGIVCFQEVQSKVVTRRGISRAPSKVPGEQ